MELIDFSNVLEVCVMYKKLFIVFLVIAALIFAGCSTGPADNPQDEPAQSVSTTGDADGGYPVTFVDSLGREISIEEKPDKVISLSPAITEILFAIGAGEQVVGVTDYCDYPEEALAKPKVGGFEDPNVELIIESEPDLIFVAAGIQEELARHYEGFGIKVISLDAETVEQVLTNIQLAGMATGNVTEATELVEEMESRINKVVDTVAQVSHRPTVFFEVWDDPLMTAGPGSFIDDLLRLAGGQSIAYDAAERFAQFSLEVLLERDPEIYLIQDHAHQPEDVMARSGYEGLSAVQQGRVAAVKDDLVTLPGPRLVEGLEIIAQILHPDLF